MNGQQKIPWQLIILVFALLGMLYIYQTPAIDNAAILALLGGACLIMGLLALRSQRQAGKGAAVQTVAQCVMGVLVLGVGVVETFHVELPQAVWYAALVVVLLAALLFGIFKRKKK